MNLFDFQSEAEKHMYKLRKLFEKLPQKGLKEEDCQKVCLLNALSNLERYVNGTTQSDIKNSVMTDEQQILNEMQHPKSERVLNTQMALQAAGCPAEKLQEATIECLLK